MKPIKIAIVENDDDERFFMKEAFEDSGLFDVIAEFENGDALLTGLAEHSDALPDLILSDLNMPGKNGFDILSVVGKNPAYPHIPVVITSTSSLGSVMTKCLDAGAADYLVKPEIFVAYGAYVENLHRRLLDKGILNP